MMTAEVGNISDCARGWIEAGVSCLGLDLKASLADWAETSS